MSIKSLNIPRCDVMTRSAFPASTYHSIRRKLLKSYYEKLKKLYWNDQGLLSLMETHTTISSAILSGTPLALGRLGGVEASILMWAKTIPRTWERMLLSSSFTDTSLGATNAGIRPRNKISYRIFSDILWEALENLDLQGVWSEGYEAACLPLLKKRALFDVETIAPDGSNPSHWMFSLEGKRVLVVTPFKETITKQIPKLGKIWNEGTRMKGVDFCLIQFPYLIDEQCTETWWEVYNKIGDHVADGDYDVALFGCGGLGLPFSSLAKNAGKVGIHLGGHAQLLFGIYGKRHLEQEWSKMKINAAWTRPIESEVPESALRVEERCYW